MGFLTQFFIKPTKANLVRMPSGSFRINDKGQVLSSTLPQWFPAAHIQAIANAVLATFGSARRAGLSFKELVIQYPALKLVARELGGSCLVFFMPENDLKEQFRAMHRQNHP